MHLASSSRRPEAADLAFVRIVASEIEAPNMLVNIVWSRWAVGQSNNATEPQRGPLDALRPRQVHQPQPALAHGAVLEVLGPHVQREDAVAPRGALVQAGARLDADGIVTLTPPCIFCMENYE